jgi:hypothetical protein
MTSRQTARLSGLKSLVSAGSLSLYLLLYAWCGVTPAGVSHWRLGDFALYRVNPPLVRIVATFPVVAGVGEAELNGLLQGFGNNPAYRQEFALGQRFLHIRIRGSV